MVKSFPKWCLQKETTNEAGGGEEVQEGGRRERAHAITGRSAFYCRRRGLLMERKEGMNGRDASNFFIDEQNGASIYYYH